MIKERKIKGVRPSAIVEDAMYYTADKKTITKRNFVKKKHIQKHDSDLEANMDWIAHKNCRG